MIPRPIVLIILDGFGCRDATEANAIAAAHKPNWDRLCKSYPFVQISGSGKCVGLPDGQMGNSEVGHMNMGAGRIIYQDLTKIDAAIESGEFDRNPVFNAALTKAKQTNKAVHVMGLLSPGGVHSHEQHWYAFVRLAAKMNINQLYLHPFLDGRDTPPQSALASLNALEACCKQEQTGEISSIIGRYYAMDRDQRFDRIQKAYDLLVDGTAEFHAANADNALLQAYTRGETDEFVQATSIHAPGAAPIKIENGDVVVFINFRSDRARELTQAFIDPDFSGFLRKTVLTLGDFICMTQYDARFNAPCAYPPDSYANSLSDVISQHHLKQLRIAETEKYAHVTFFFNCGVEAPKPYEDRILIPSPKVATYDLKPEMSAPEITTQLVQVIENQTYDVIICNFANADMVGHSGNFEATVKAIEAIDRCLGLIINALASVGGEAIITADHGNAEQMFDENTQQPHTAHTSDPIPFLYIGRKAEIVTKNGKLSDIAPTILYLMNISQPAEMTGKSIVKLV